MGQNEEQDFAWNFIENTGSDLFLTGKAGTGKTTFLKRLKEKCPKRMIVLAPTGIAAINAGGMTIHSFFQLPFAPFVPETTFSAGKAKYSFRFGKEKIRIIRSVDLIVIDEISMVRADLMDAMDNVLRRYRNRDKPFGGVQLLMIGDLQQLSPVIKDEEWQLLKNYYDTPYFFSSRALKNTGYFTIELKTVYRQSDSRFLDILNGIRENRCSKDILEKLNSRYIPDFRPQPEEGYIRLVTHNRQAQRINAAELDRLPGKACVFKAETEGQFPEYSFPTEEMLELKEGAQIMFVKNDISKEKRYFNGMIGEVTGISGDRIEVRSKDRPDETFVLQKEEWANAKYVLDEESREIREEIDGIFRQYPVKLAWAITIHKSQGLTFDKAIIDTEYAFAHGQTYVALSRCRTLEGLVLSRPLTSRAVINDAAVEEFTEKARLGRPDGNRVRDLERAYFLDTLSGLFDFQDLHSAMKRYVRLADEYFYRAYPRQTAVYREGLEEFASGVMEVAAKFKRQYSRMTGLSEDYAFDMALQERIRSGAVYFGEKLEIARKVFADALSETDGKEAKKRLKDAVEELSAALAAKTKLLEYVKGNGFSLLPYLKHKAVISLETKQDTDRKKRAPREKKDKGDPAKKQRSGEQRMEVPSDILHPELFRRLRAWRSATAAAQGVPAYVVMQQKALTGIANLLPGDEASLIGIPYFGKKRAGKYGEKILGIVREYCDEKGIGYPEEIFPHK